MRTVAPTPERRHHRWAMIAGTTLVVWFFSEMYFVDIGEFFYAWSRREGLPQVLLATAEAVGVWLAFHAFFVLWLLHAIAFFRVCGASGRCRSPAPRPCSRRSSSGWSAVRASSSGGTGRTRRSPTSCRPSGGGARRASA